MKTDLKNKIKELRKEWLNKEITLWDLDKITGELIWAGNTT